MGLSIAREIADVYNTGTVHSKGAIDGSVAVLLLPMYVQVKYTFLFLKNPFSYQGICSNCDGSEILSGADERCFDFSVVKSIVDTYSGKLEITSDSKNRIYYEIQSPLIK